MFTPPATETAVITVRPWIDPVVEAVGFGPRSDYVEACWLPVLGPTATWLYRRLGPLACQFDAGVEVDLVELAAGIGLSRSVSRHSPIIRSLGRLIRFEVVRCVGSDLLVRRLVAPLTHRQLAGVSDEVRSAHYQLTRPHRGAR